MPNRAPDIAVTRAATLTERYRSGAYVEDAPDNVGQLRQDGFQTIVFSNSTNQYLPGPRADTWGEVEGLVMEHLAGWERGT